MNKRIKRLFCIHKYIAVSRVYPMIELKKGKEKKCHGQVWQCDKCGKIIQIKY